MTHGTPDLTTRLLAALDAEQQIAERATPGEWKESDHNRYLVVSATPVSGSSLVTDASHIAHQHPRRTLRRIAALRRIVERHRPIQVMRNRQAVDGLRCHGCYQTLPCPDLLDLAAALGVEP